MNTEIGITDEESPMETLVKQVFLQYGGEERYELKGDMGDEILYTDKNGNFLILVRKEDPSGYYVVACQEIDKKSDEGFVTAVYTKNGGSPKKVFTRNFPIPKYESIRAEAGGLTKKLKYSDNILEEIK